jgi:hypothetical protein
MNPHHHDPYQSRSDRQNPPFWKGEMMMKQTTLLRRLTKAIAVIGPIAVAELLGSGPAAAATSDISCVPTEVLVFAYRNGNPLRLHVRCASAVAGISFFALPTADAPVAARILSILTTAQVAGKTLGIRYDPADTSGEKSIGCLASDCRLIRAVWIGQ